MLRKKGWGERRLVGLPMRKWRSSKCQMIDGALDIKFFQNIKLVNLITIYDERYL